MTRKSLAKNFSQVLNVIFALLCIVLISPYTAYSQREKPKNRPYADYRRFHLGFHVGTHTQDMVIQNFGKNSAISESGSSIFGEMEMFSPGFSVGIILNYSPILDLDVRLVPTLHLGERSIAFANEKKEQIDRFDLRSNMIELPLLVKYSSQRLNNMRPYIIAGPYTAFQIGQRVASPIKFKLVDYGMKIGVGCDIYLHFFKLCPELTFGYGIPNVIEYNRPELIDDNRLIYTQTIKRASTRMIMFTINFE